MYSVIFLVFASFALSLILTPQVRNLALRFGLVDRPDEHRKTHKLPIPRVGGIAVITATVSAYALLLIVRLSAGHIVRSGAPFAVRLLPAVLVIFAVGLADDIFDLRPWYKLSAQILAAILAWQAGIRLYSIDSHPFTVTTSFFITVVWIVACSNAVNLIDGVDGLATGIGLFATITTLIAGLLHQNIELVFATAPLAGALLGFLRYNFNPASIFLGDCGSLTLGFLLGCYGLVWCEKSSTLLSMTAPLLALSIPLLDAALAVARRFLTKKPIFGADRSHIHHKLLSRGLTPRRVVLVLYGCCALAAAASLMLTAIHQKYQGFVIVLVSLVALLGLQHLGYREFSIAGKLAFDGSFRRLLNAELVLIGFEQELSSAATLQQSWEVLCRVSPQFGFTGSELKLDGVVCRGEAGSSWRVRIEFPGHGYINLNRTPGVTDRGATAVLFIDRTSRLVSNKLKSLESELVELPVYANAD
ncbi:MAG: MraY family glycosyltransferase [Terracidiphilus sp.]|jgi:UDP-GlcNAc:undecaprenyl-phosphate GlcNAc-1-phosphate transferase